MSETPACSPLLSGMIALAREAGEVILGFYDGRAEVALKADASPVTAADLAAEEVILAGLRRLAPEVPVIAEEAVARGAKPKAARQFFLVDPLDGTKEFISRNGEFTVNIALIEAGHPVAGVVYAPAIGRLFWGETGKGAAEARVAGPAAPEAELYPRFGRTMEWDTAAGHAVLAAAGGSVRTADGAPLLYGKEAQGFANPAFIASAEETRER